MTVTSINMPRPLEQLRYASDHDCFSETELVNAFGHGARRYALAKRAFASGELIRLKRGLYCLGERHRHGPPNLFEIAQRMYGPSYVSFESALSYHGWIPESVPTVTSACARRSKTFNTPVGIFSFTHLPARVFLTGAERIAKDRGAFFMASPWKALVDYVWANKKDWRGLQPLIKSLRIDEERLKDLPVAELEEIDAACKSGRVSKFIEGVIREAGV